MINPIVLSLVACVLYMSIKESNIRMVPANIIMPALLIVLFAPGLLVSIPPSGKGILMSGQSSVAASVVHAVIVGLIFAVLLKKFPQFY